MKQNNINHIAGEIREVEREWKQIFSVKEKFSENMDRWRDEHLYDMYDHNQFVPNTNVRLEELQQAYAYQRENNWDFLKIDSREPLANEYLETLHLEGGVTDTMVLLEDTSSTWKMNNQVVVRDVKLDDIGEAIEEIELINYESVYGEDFAKRKIRWYIEKAKEVEGFHYYAAFLDGNAVGACYGYEKNGYVQIDGLIVNESARNQYVATTLLKHIADTCEGMLFLHADPDDTPKDMYKKMGFVVVDSLYEYSLIRS